MASILCMVASLVLGMGLPSTACYIVTATIAAPAMQTMGVNPLAAHFFAFYFGTMSGVVPPVALTSFTAAGLAGAKPTKVALVGLALASSGLILPFLFVYNPVLLLVDFSWGPFLYEAAIAALGIFALSVSFIGIWRSQIPFWERVLFFASGIALVNPAGEMRVVSIGAFILLMTVHFLLSKARSRPSPAV